MTGGMVLRKNTFAPKSPKKYSCVRGARSTPHCKSTTAGTLLNQYPEEQQNIFSPGGADILRRSGDRDPLLLQFRENVTVLK